MHYLTKHTHWLCVSLLLLSSPTHAQDSIDCVILLHGLLRSDHSLSKIELALAQHHYQVVNQDYPSTQYPIDKLSTEAINKALKKCDPDNNQIHFVTHSLGGILVRYYMKHYDIEKIGRVVMLAPPNGGSEVVDKLGHWPLFQWINGPAGTQLGTSLNSMPIQLGAVDFELGIIAGNYSYNWLLSYLIPGKDDGKVAVHNTKVTGMTDHITLPVSHIFIMNNNDVIQQILDFLQDGQFNHINESPTPQKSLP